MDIIDTSDLLDELRTMVGGDEDHPDAEIMDELDAEDTARMEAIDALRAEIGDEFRYGVTLVARDNFIDYTRESAEDIGAIPTDGQWPTYCIDWEWASRELSHDFSSVDLQRRRLLLPGVKPTTRARRMRATSQDATRSSEARRATQDSEFVGVTA